MHMKLRVSIVITCIVTGYMGALLGAVLILVPLRILPQPYALVFSTLIFVVGSILSIKNFLDLISISGVGPGTAVVILSYLSPKELTHAIIADNVKTIQSIKSI